MIARALDAFRVAVAAAQAVLAGERVVLVRELEAAEWCSCPRPRVVLVHEPGSYCGDGQIEQVAVAIDGSSTDDPADMAADVLDRLAALADERDAKRGGVR